MKPSIEQIKSHFNNAKQIKCLRMKGVVDVTYVTDFEYNEKDNSYTSSGVVTFWKDGVYAEIVKCKKCKNCNCK